MAAIVQNLVPVPGLHIPPTIETLQQSSLEYSHLPDDGDQPEIQQQHLQELASLLLRFNVQEKFGIHLIHGHFQISKDDFMLGTALKSLPGCWTKPTSIHEIDPDKIHGHIFKINKHGRLHPYEYREGPNANIDGVDPMFFHSLVDYLRSNHLDGLLGLQVLSKESPEMMGEFILENNGTVMLDAKCLKSWTSHRLTGFAIDAPGATELKGKETHAETTKDTHRVFYDGKLAEEDELCDVLRAEDIIY